jgi:hypothetical protein
MMTEPQGPTGGRPRSTYPARVTIDYVDGPRNRISVLFRILMVIPIIPVLYGFTTIVLPVLLMILFRKKYPRWWFDFNLQLARFSSRVGAYIGLLTDDYPSTDEEQGVHLDIDYPDASQLNRLLPLVKWILAIPHIIVLYILFAVSFPVVILGWFAILFTGKFPRGFHNFLVGVSRWSLRVQAYALLLVTDEYPPFSLD